MCPLKKMVQEQDSCLKSHVPTECKRCISAVFHWAAFAGYWQKPPTNKLSVHKSQLLDFQNEFSHLPFSVSFLLVTNVYRTHPCHFKLYFSLYYIWQCTLFSWCFWGWNLRLSKAPIFSSTDFPRLLLSADLPTLIFTERLIALYNDVAFYSNCGHFLQFAEQQMQQDRATHKSQQSSRMSSSLKIRAAE